ncbi:MICOS complex subunit MIC10 [Trichonephila inaurata madagascariensis]|uniref:MICOS complex subunit MIC10 n=1 Tax=Trichonephila inaurata madagascariensis TaxID=2747483 RepID=A0A8X6WZ46_9ARAC|nr:MICOS complex subunit MIC10 [Trichonephila inaurata madagascariensis]
MSSKSEDIVGETWDYCFADSLIKVGSGLAVGSVLSLVMFKRKMWPIVFGMGSGFGMGLANCQHAFRNPHLTKMLNYKLKQKEGQKSESAKQS